VDNFCFEALIYIINKNVVVIIILYRVYANKGPRAKALAFRGVGSKVKIIHTFEYN
jgi:hypothetical protein